MLYIFQVDTGNMMRLDMNLALESVDVLKEHIQEVSGIPSAKQILLINGGVPLDSTKTVCSYSAGTDTNPIYLFSKCDIECPNGPPLVVDQPFHDDIEQKIREHCDLPVTLSTVTKRAQCAAHLYDLARDLQATCENLVLDQHLQQQGWSAVLANLDDIVTDFRRKFSVLEQTYEDYMECRDSYQDYLSNFNEDLEQLKRIPLLSVLWELHKQNSEREGGGDSKMLEDNAVSNSCSSTDNKLDKEITLFEWLSSEDRSILEYVYEHCQNGLEQFDDEIFSKFRREVDRILENADSNYMKEIKGLGERLFRLDHLLREIKALVRQQGEYAQAFLNNQSRANNTKDNSVLPDLCASHKQQLLTMELNHNTLRDMKKRCILSKNELNSNLHSRLGWVMFVEQQMADVTNKFLVYHESLKNLQHFLKTLQQVHLTPTTYLNTIVEVVRRREFSQAYLEWSSELACHLLTIHNEEVARRKEFQSQLQDHYVKQLFPGLEDLPPAYATQAPSLFDTSLPKVTEDDVERLKRELPELEGYLHVPDMSAVTNFFLIKSVIIKKEDEKQEGETDSQGKIVEVTSDNSNIDGERVVKTLPHLKDLDRGCESETDTEEFEKVGQSPLEMNFDQKNQIPSLRPPTQDVSTITEDNLLSSKSEHEKLTTVLIKLQSFSIESLGQLRLGLSEIKNQVLSDRSTLSQSCESLGSSWENILFERDSKEKEMIDNLKKNHEQQLNDLKIVNLTKTKEIERLKLEKTVLENDILKANEALKELRETFDRKMAENLQEIEELHKEIQNKDAEREKNQKQITDMLHREHRAEIENIRSRFKLMTMERSPSDTSLEKSGDFNSLPSHTTLLMQMTENFEMDKERAVNEALVKERSKWETILDKKIQSLETKFDAEKEQLVKRITEDKDKQIDVLRERERNLSLECVKYKDTIQQLAESLNEAFDSNLFDRFHTLQKEKESLAVELEKFKKEKSIEDSKDKVDVTTSPIKEKELMTSSSSSTKPDKIGRLNIDQCKTGDCVLVIWDSEHENFRILQESKYKYFLHAMCLDSLGLEVHEGRPNKMYCVGEVVDKDYCYARKPENRYRVSKGSKFFRVKVRPTNHPSSSRDLSQSSYHSTKSSITHQDVMSQSQSVIGSMFESTFVEKCDGSSSPPASPPKHPPAILERDETDSIFASDQKTLTGDASFSSTGQDFSSLEQVTSIFKEQVVTGTEEVVTSTEQTDASMEPVGKLDSIEHHFAEDSGIVENIDQARAALDDCQNDCESSARFLISLLNSTFL